MYAFLPGLPGTDDLRAVVRRIDTARHHGAVSYTHLTLPTTPYV